MTTLKEMKAELEAKFEVISIEELFKRIKKLFKNEQSRIISVNGSVAVGKTTFTEKLKDYFISQDQTVQVIHTDSFLLSNEKLAEGKLMNKKGFPITYQQEKILGVLKRITSNEFPIVIPHYSHTSYNIIEEYETIESADIFIIEGIGFDWMHTSNMIDLSIFLDSNIKNIKEWYKHRIIKNISLAEPDSFFKKYENCSNNELKKIIDHNWIDINLINYYENILPEKIHSDIILEKNETHEIIKIYYKK